MYRLIASNSVDQHILQRAMAKLQLERAVIHQKKFKGLDQLAKEAFDSAANDLVDLLRSDFGVAGDQAAAASSSSSSNTDPSHDTVSDDILTRLIESVDIESLPPQGPGYVIMSHHVFDGNGKVGRTESSVSLDSEVSMQDEEGALADEE